MISMLGRRSDAPRFHFRWRGYDRAEVEEFLRETAADRQRLREDLAQLETVMARRSHVHERELERLTALRAEVVRCLETSVGALDTATRLLASAELPAPALQHAPPAPAPRRRWTRPTLPTMRLPKLSWTRVRDWGGSSRVRVALGAVSSIAGLVLLVLGLSSQPPASTTPAIDAPADANVATTARATTPVDAAEGLLLTLTARGVCWIRTMVDGAQPLERLLQANDTIVLRANDEAVLRVGDAAALSVLINNRPAKPLGAPGEVVTTHITTTNYPEFLSSN